MWDIFFAFVLVGAGAVLALHQLRQWKETKNWAHLLISIVAILSELAVMIGMMESLVLLVFGLILWLVINNRRP